MNLTDYNLSQYMTMRGNVQVYNADYIIRNICNSVEGYVVNYGLAIIIIYILISWLCWYTFKHGYKRMTYDSSNPLSKFIGDLSILDNRIYWDSWIRDKLAKLMLGFIAVIVWLNW